jgi:hypothetical protein
MSQIIIVSGFAVLLVSIVLMILTGSLRAAYIVDHESGSMSDIDYSYTLEPNHEYEIIVTFYDRAGSEFERARVEGTVIFYIDGVEVDRAQLADYRDDEDEISSVSAFYYYMITPSATVELTISGELVDGDEWWINVFRDVPAYLDQLGLVTGVLFLLSFVVIIIGAGLFLKAKRSMEASTTQTVSSNGTN